MAAYHLYLVRGGLLSFRRCSARSTGESQTEPFGTLANDPPISKVFPTTVFLTRYRSLYLNQPMIQASKKGKTGRRRKVESHTKYKRVGALSDTHRIFLIRWRRHCCTLSGDVVVVARVTAGVAWYCLYYVLINECC
jgi:hypothetical protein